MRKWSHSFSIKLIKDIVWIAPNRHNCSHRLLGAVLFALALILTFGSPAMCVHKYVWTERQPAGDVDKYWKCTASSSDGAKLIVGAYRLYTSTDTGSTWIERQPAGDVDRAWTGLASSSDGTRLVAGVYGGRLYTSQNGGETWIERRPAGDADYYWTSVANSSDGVKLIATAFNDYIYTSTDTGATWTEHQAGGSIQCWFCSASSADGNKLIAGVYSNRLYASTNSGVTWNETQPAGDVDKHWHCTASSADGARFIAGVFTGGLYTSTDAGITWTERYPQGIGNANWWCTASSSDGIRLITGSNPGWLHSSSDGGETWIEQQPVGDMWRNWACVVNSSDGTRLIAASCHGIWGIKDGRVYTGTLQTFFTVSGYVRASDSTGIDSVVMSGLPGNPLTDTNGYYNVEVDSGWSGDVTPVKDGYTFDPESTSYSNVTDDQETDYTGTLLTFTISGYVRNTDSVGVEGVVLSGLPGDPATDTEGYYAAAVPYGWSGRVTPTDTCVFDPEYRDYDSVTSDQTYQSYVEDCFSQGVDDDKDNLVPKKYQLSQNHPNPFNPETEIVFDLPKADFVTLRIYNILGQEVTTLVNKNMSAGRYRITWNGTDKSGRAVSSGVYFYRMQSGDFAQTKQMLLLK